MKFEELEIGGVYVFHYGKKSYIGKIIKKGQVREYLATNINLTYKMFQINGSFRFNINSTPEGGNYCSCSRKATQDEINWLNACIKKKTYVPFEDTVIVCEIW
jgi:hypothetical protein